MTKQATKKAKVNEASSSSTDVPEGRDIAWEWDKYDDRKLRRVKYDWWILHGVGVPCLQKFAIRVLSLTVSASPCERNWSTFENLYSKKRNKFLKHKLSESIFIQYNKNLQRRYEEENKYSGDEDAYRPIFLEAFDENDDWIIPQGGGLVREGEDLTWEQDNAASGDMDVGPSTRLRRKERSDTHPTFSLLSEEPDDEYLPPI
ncbi:uncharacterized protein LOC113277419 isoform X2 [Papaver somniferum]|uniref:uncharacterized protein LOC113277419 isoform X2 n=1 Tax=Papaver somniferum TaxID=3469 RepID=UPI000E700EAF|nr:uncharacterized protein LOC113277419 isoform X2 [Papaver somniferum]XP_026382305.1 uncharacterized protein LOC113277419 isoform X2 [Papaver somniferum]XP_026382306.1 uncharacterized protein LOC113277419 isoform X2 [Papaver somniferum]